MKLLHRLFPVAAITLAATLSTVASHAADFPTHPIEMVVPSSPGGGTDVMARLYAETAKKFISQPIVVNNKPGASGAIGMSEVQRAPADGYKVAVLISELAIIPHLGMTKMTVADFIPLGRLNGDPGMIAVRAESPYQTIEELIEKTKK